MNYCSARHAKNTETIDRLIEKMDEPGADIFALSHAIEKLMYEHANDNFLKVR